MFYNGPLNQWGFPCIFSIFRLHTLTALHTPPVKPPTSYQKAITSMLSNCLSQLSCSQEEFEKAASDYQEAMLKSGFAGELEYVKTNGSTKRSRKRNIMWFNPH